MTQLRCLYDHRPLKIEDILRLKQVSEYRREQMIRRAFELAKAVTQMRIRVAQRDIDEGVQSNCFHCPVARAGKRVFKATEVWVREIIIVTKAGAQRTYVTPTAAVDFIERFDSAMLEFESPKHFSFTLDERVRATLGGNRASKG